jgi:undecaprenyl-diphosphatase
MCIKYSIRMHGILFAMGLLEALVLGLVQGITEFLPVSSTGHLVLAQEWIVVDQVNDLALVGILHLATTLAVIVYFWNDLWLLVQVALRKLGQLPVNERDITLLYALVIGTIPAALIGFFAEDFIDKYFLHDWVVALVLLVAAFFFMYAEWRNYLHPSHAGLTIKKGFLVGLFQVMALIPGMSRSGSTIGGGMILGMSRYEATRFSFLLAVPITLGVGAKKLLDLIAAEGDVAWGLVTLSAVVAFVTALLVIHYFLQFIRKYTLWPFVWYSMILAGMVGYVHFIT